MTKRIAAVAVLAMAMLSAYAAKMPKWVKNSRNAVCQIIAYDDQGNECGRSTGFFIDAEGNGISQYDIFSTAVRAVAVDSKGISRDILYVTGANRIYDAARFKVVPDKSLVSLTSSDVSATEGETLYLLTYSTESTWQPSVYTVAAKVTMANDYSYYTLSGDICDAAGAPVMNALGQVVGVMQSSVEGDTGNYAVDINYVKSLSISSALALNDDDYRRMAFPKSLPDNEEQALVYIYMNQGVNPDYYMSLLDRFIEQYPGSSEGYIKKAIALIYGNDSTQYADGIALMDKGVSIAEKKDDALYQYANLIYTTLTGGIRVNAEGWSLESALDKINAAIAIEEVPSYLQLQGNILFALTRYDEALTSYNKLNKTTMASAETYYYTSVIKGKLNASPDEIIATLDSAVNFYGRPYTSVVAPFILERATTKEENERYRDAVLDLNEYEQIVGKAGLTAEFFYFREQIEVKARMYEQAMKDIEQAISLSPADLGLTLELSSLLLRVGMADQALPILQELADNNPEDTDCLRLLGICLMQSDKNGQARQYLQKAKELGDELASQLLEKL